MKDFKTWHYYLEIVNISLLFLYIIKISVNL